MSEDSFNRIETKSGSTQTVGSNSKPCVSELGPDQQNEQKTCSKDVKVTSNKDANSARWSFVEPTFSRTAESDQNDRAETEQVYVHPHLKRSSTQLFRKEGLEIWTEIPFSETASESVRMAGSSGFGYTKLSKNSLDMCTESLGNESGY